MISGNADAFSKFLPADAIMRALASAEVAPLIDSTAWSRLLRLCALFPVGVQTVCFECRLAADDPRVDLAFCVMAGPEVQRLSAAVRAAQHAHTAWTRFADFLEAWSAFEAPWSTRVPFVCPAFDLDTDAHELPPPCLSVCVDANFYARRLGIAPNETADTAELLALARDCHARLTGSDMPPLTAARLRECLDTGLEVEPKHMSWMLSRPSSPIKLDVRLRAIDIAPFLTRIRFPGRVDHIMRRVRALADVEGHVQLNLVLYPDLGGPLELELFSVASDASTDARFALLERLVAAGIASAPKAEVLRAAWLQPKCEDEVRRVVAKSWYIKLRFGGHEGCDAKVYFGLVPRLLRSSPIL